MTDWAWLEAKEGACRMKGSEIMAMASSGISRLRVTPQEAVLYVELSSARAVGRGETPRQRHRYRFVVASRYNGETKREKVIRQRSGRRLRVVP